MGKYAATRAFRQDRKNYQSGKNSFSGTAAYATELPHDRSQFQFQAFLYGFDPTGLYRGFLQSRDSTNYWSDYFSNTGVDWSDIKYPTRMYGFGSTGSTARSAFMISKNIASLY